eukprot:TRINITY_DN4463_c0_g1_i2.p1 TRINITY_DN4463_c0_g1~~TRINITY_DN4463_c0_g1_i2.p1  ORF type:complete len:142 (-),score=32.25 TRINITY_DN4463_c0_g1_i2:1260-1685(-)
MTGLSVITLLFIHLSVLFQKGSSTLCYIGNSPVHIDSEVINCEKKDSSGTELYCRNITSPDGSVHRSCVAMSQYDTSWEEFGCQDSPGGFVRCTCGHDLCNAPWSYESSSETPSSSSSSSKEMNPSAQIPLLLFILSILMV